MPPKTSGNCQKDRQGRQVLNQGRWQEETQEEEGILLFLHLQGPEAGPPRHWYQLQGHVHHELLCQSTR